MIIKKILTMFLFFVLASFSFEAWAGPLVWGPKKYVRDTGKPYVVIDSFTIEKPKGKYWLQISNGEGVQKPGADVGVVEMKNMVSSAIIWVNGEKVVTPDDFNQKVYGFTKDITLGANNSIEVEVRGVPKSFITIKIRKAELNEMAYNKENDLRGENMQDQIGLWWSPEENASEYVIYKAYSIEGIWMELGSVPLTNAVDITPEAQTRDLCYKIEAVDSKGKVIRVYEPICVPKWQEEESSLPLTSNEASSDTVISRLFDENISSLPSSPLWGEEKGEGIFSNERFGKTCSSGRDSPSFQVAELSLADRFQLTDTPTPLVSNPNLFLEPSDFQLALNTSTQSSTQSSLPPYDKINKMCLSDDEFIDTTTMDYEDIKKFLEDKKSFLSDVINDVNDKPLDPALLIFLAAQDNGINPQVLIATLQKERGSVRSSIRLTDYELKTIMGYGKPSTIRDQIYDAASQMRKDFNLLTNGKPTYPGDWQVGKTKYSGDPDNPKMGYERDASGNLIPVTPANKAVAILFSYTPWVGERWGGRKFIGGNSSFCKLWDQYNFGTPCPSEPVQLTLTGLDDAKVNEIYTATGGTEPYTYSISGGSINPATGQIISLPSCASGQPAKVTITATDSCGKTGTKDVRMPNGVWVVVSSKFWPCFNKDIILDEPAPCSYWALTDLHISVGYCIAINGITRITQYHRRWLYNSTRNCAVDLEAIALCARGCCNPIPDASLCAITSKGWQTGMHFPQAVFPTFTFTEEYRCP